MKQNMKAVNFKRDFKEGKVNETKGRGEIILTFESLKEKKLKY